MDIISIAKSNDLDLLKQKLKFNDINIVDTNGDSLLHIAVRNQNIDMARFLILNACDINKRNEEGNTPLHFSIFYTNIGVFKLLIRNNANINLQNNDLDTPLFLALKRGLVDQVRIILELDNDISLKNSYGEPYPFLMLEENLYPILKDEIRHNKSILYLHDDYGNNLLHKAAKINAVDAINDLSLDRYLINEFNNIGVTPIWYSAYNAYLSSVRILMEKLAIIDYKNKFGETIFDISNDRVSGYLNELSNSYSYQGYMRKHQLHIAVIKNDSFTCKRIINLMNINQHDSFGLLPIDYAYMYNHKDLIKLLKNY